MKLGPCVLNMEEDEAGHDVTLAGLGFGGLVYASEPKGGTSNVTARQVCWD